MNINDGIGNRASQLPGGELVTKKPVHPNDHVNLGQSVNDTFPTAMDIATLLEIRQHVLPQLGKLIDSVWAKAIEWVEVVKIGRTHLENATPLTVGQQWSGWAPQLRDARHRLETALQAVYELGAGGTVVGTGLNALRGFGEETAARLAGLTALPLKTRAEQVLV
jgi:fumarate hydratase class II